MKKILIMSIMMFSIMMFAQSPSVQWAENGLPIRQGLNIEWTRAAASMDDGVVVVWSDTQNGGRDLVAQKIDSEGNKMWGENDLIIDNKVNRQEDPVIIKTTDNSVIIAWVDYSDDEAGDVYAQKVSSDGNLLWEIGGTPLCVLDGEQKSLNIVPDQNGGALVIWLDKRDGNLSHIYGQHLNSDGTIQWDENGILLSENMGGQSSHTFWEDGQGGAILAYVNKVTDKDIYATRIQGDGSQPWGNHIIISNANLDQESPKITPDGTGSFVVTWRDLRNTNHGEIYAQKINLDGTLSWDQETIVASGDFDHKNPRITSSANGNVIIVWEDGRNDPSYMDLFVQKIDNSGNLVWNEEGVAIATENFHQQNPRIISDENDGAFIVWDDARNNDHPNEDIYIQHILSNGNVEFASNGRVVCNAIGQQYSALARKVDDGVMVIWGDKRSGSDAMYSQIMDNSGNYVLPENGMEVKSGLSGDAENLICLNRNNYVYMIWIDSRKGNFGKQIYMQIIDGNGDILLPENGVAIANNNGADQERLSVVLAPDNGIVASWVQLENGYNQVYSQYVTDDGTPQWGDDGLKITELNTSEQTFPLISYDNGAYYVVFEDNRDDSIKKIYAQKIVDGEIQWNDGKLIATNPLIGDYDLKSLSGRYVIWNNPANQFILCKMFDENGFTAPGWTTDGLVIKDLPAIVNNLKSKLSGDNLIITWDSVNGEFQKDIFSQMVNPSGQEMFEHNGVNIAGGYLDQTDGNLYLGNNIYLVYTDFQNGVSNQIYAEKLSNSLLPIWDNPILLGDDSGSQFNPTINSAGNNFLAVWEKVTETTTDLSMQIFNPYGGIHGNSSGETLCDKPFNQIDAKIVRLDDDNDVISWIDSRSSGKTEIKGIYVQKISVTTGWTDNEDNEINPLNNSLHQNYPNPFVIGKSNRGVTSIKFELKYSQEINLSVFNIKGQKIITLSNDKLSKGTHIINWDGKNSKGSDVSSGVYFYSLKANGSTQFKKMLVIK